MWKPEGSLTWRDALSQIHRDIEQVISNTFGEMKNVSGELRYIHTAEHYLLKSGKVKNYAEARLVIALMTCFLMANLMDEYPPMAASLDGRKVELDWVFFTHKDQLELCCFSWPLQEDATFRRFFELSELHNFRPEDLYDRFAFINAETGMLRVKNGTERHLNNQLGLEERSVQDVLAIAETLKGFLLYWPEPFNQQELRDFYGILEEDRTFSASLDAIFGQRIDTVTGLPAAASPAKRGRPASALPAVKNALHECYPEGVEDIPMKEIWLKLETNAGKRFSERTVRRAIEQCKVSGKIT